MTLTMPVPQVQPVTVLAIETAGRTRSVALVNDNGLVAEFSLNVGYSHSRQLLPEIEAMLHSTQTGMADLTAIAVSCGPGSFTGLRIGMATAKGLARALDIPLFTIPTLDGLAAQATCSQYPVCAVSQARKNELYLALYESRFPDPPRRKSDYLALYPPEVADLIKTPTLFIGVPGYESYELDRIVGENFLPAPPEICRPRAAAIGMLAIKRLHEGESPATDTAEPLYVKVSQAEENQRRQLQSDKDRE